MKKIYNFDYYIFDCDGVILQSNEIKTKAFKKTLSEFAKSDVNKLIDFHQSNGGMSRRKKLEYFFINILKKDTTSIDHYLDRFRKFAFDDLCGSNLIPGVYLFLELLSKNNKPCFVASGSLESELKEIFNIKGLSYFFKDIYGTPVDKNTNVVNIKNFFNNDQRGVFFGDSKMDFEVSTNNNLDFYFIKHETEWKNYNKYINHNIINNFLELI